MVLHGPGYSLLHHPGYTTLPWPSSSYPAPLAGMSPSHANPHGHRTMSYRRGCYRGVTVAGRGDFFKAGKPGPGLGRPGSPRVHGSPRTPLCAKRRKRRFCHFWSFWSFWQERAWSPGHTPEESEGRARMTRLNSKSPESHFGYLIAQNGTNTPEESEGSECSEQTGGIGQKEQLLSAALLRCQRPE